MILLLLQSLYLFSPLLVASGLSALAIHFGWFKAFFTPIDAGLTLRGRRLFGDNKTWRGVLVAVLGAVAGVAAQKALPADMVGDLAVVDYAQVNPLAMGAAMGCGATLGELPNSFVKRQLGVAPGGTASGARAALFFVWDQVDTVLGAFPLLRPWLHPSWALFAASLIVALVIHPAASLLGYALGVRRSAR